MSLHAVWKEDFYDHTGIQCVLGDRDVLDPDGNSKAIFTICRIFRRFRLVGEHSVIGGLGSAVCDALAEKCPVPVKKIGVQDVFGESGPAVALLAKYKLDGAVS